MWSGAWNKRKLTSDISNRFLASSVRRAWDCWSGGCEFKPHWGWFLMKFILCCVTLDLSDNLTEMRLKGLTWKTHLFVNHPISLFIFYLSVCLFVFCLSGRLPFGLPTCHSPCAPLILTKPTAKFSGAQGLWHGAFTKTPDLYNNLKKNSISLNERMNEWKQMSEPKAEGKKDFGAVRLKHRRCLLTWSLWIVQLREGPRLPSLTDL